MAREFSNSGISVLVGAVEGTSFDKEEIGLLTTPLSCCVTGTVSPVTESGAFSSPSGTSETLNAKVEVISGFG